MRVGYCQSKIYLFQHTYTSLMEKSHMHLDDFHVKRLWNENFFVNSQLQWTKSLIQQIALTQLSTFPGIQVPGMR